MNSAYRRIKRGDCLTQEALSIITPTENTLLQANVSNTNKDFKLNYIGYEQGIGKIA